MVSSIDSLTPIIIKFIDLNFAREGYGFVTPSQLKNEIRRTAVFIALSEAGEIVGVRVGVKTVYNLCVHKEYRGMGIGRLLLEYSPPSNIRVKAQPVGHLSKVQRDNFKSPEGFYERCGYGFLTTDFSRNFFAGDSTTGKRIYYKEGKQKHIRIYRTESDLNLIRRSLEYAQCHPNLIRGSL